MEKCPICAAYFDKPKKTTYSLDWAPRESAGTPLPGSSECGKFFVTYTCPKCGNRFPRKQGDE